ncbi:DUF3817 domain-containing protein [Planosporangium sp. 12N6]|uniref:DUF3817 domain-containing protein n=1 Tax=Planosporangium spinosum TaxID=3402278 RepID=UPI003CF4D560
MFRTPARAFRTVAVAEAFSWLGLLIGMFFKYVVVHNPVGVKLFGPIHGMLFLAYLGTLLMLARQERWRPLRLATGAAAAVPPFASVIFERWAARRRTAPEPAAAAPAPVGSSAR